MCENVLCGCCPGRESEGSAVFFNAWQTGFLFNGGFDQSIVFQNYDNSRGFCFQNNVLTLFTPGIYFVSYKIYVPSGETLDTTFTLKANGVIVPSATVRAEHTDGSPSSVYSAQAVIPVGCYPLSLTLSSSEAVNYTIADASSLANLTVYRIGGK